MKFQSDDIYIDQVLNGNNQAFAMLVDKYKTLVYTVAFRILKNHEDTEEIVQDAFVKAYQALGNFERKSKFSTWLHRIVYNTAISKTRKKRFETNPLDDYLIENYSIEEPLENLDELSASEQKNLLNQLLEKLNAEESAIISMFYLSDQTTGEIAEITGLTQSNVKVKLHRIRGKLQVYLKQLLKKNLTSIKTES